MTRFEERSDACALPFRILFMTGRLLRAAAVTGFAAMATPLMAADALPGDATSLTEVHGDWTVRCVLQDGAVQCGAQQEQISNQTRVLTIELRPGNGGLAGTLILPFGLLLKSGAALKVDDKVLLEPQSFRTCLPLGCVVPLVLGADQAKAMRAGTTLGITAQAVSGQDAKFSVSLQGLDGALNRIAALAK